MAIRVRTLAPAADLPWLRTVTDVGADPELEKLRAAMYAGTDQGSYPREMRLLLRTDNRAAIANRLKGRPTA